MKWQYDLVLCTALRVVDNKSDQRELGSNVHYACSKVCCVSMLSTSKPMISTHGEKLGRNITVDN